MSSCHKNDIFNWVTLDDSSDKRLKRFHVYDGVLPFQIKWYFFWLWSSKVCLGKEVHQWLISPQWPSMWNETHAHTQTHIHTQIIQRIPSHTMMTPWTGATLSLRAWLPFNSVKMDITVPLHAWYHVFLEAGCTNRPPVFHINHIISLFKYHNVFLYDGQLDS